VNELQFAGLTSTLIFWSTPGISILVLRGSAALEYPEQHEYQYFMPDPLFPEINQSLKKKT
jgi:hypothetical protein